MELLLALALAAPHAAGSAAGSPEEPIQPDRPGIADGSTVIGPGYFQIEVGVQRQESSSGGRDGHMLFTPLLLRGGLDPRWEARLETNAFTKASVPAAGAGVNRSSGYSPVSLGVKYHFQDAKSSTGNLSLGTILRIFPPSGSSAFRTHHVTSDLRLAADWNLGPDWALNPNIGLAIYEDDAGKTFTAGLGALTLTYGSSKRLQPYLDVGVQSPESPSGPTAVIFDGGATYLLDRNTQIDFAIGTGLAGRTSPDFLWTVGLSRRFGTARPR
jgi:Putative MetA-pathway of phenol degradation